MLNSTKTYVAGQRQDILADIRFCSNLAYSLRKEITGANKSKAKFGFWTRNIKNHQERGWKPPRGFSSWDLVQLFSPTLTNLNYSYTERGSQYIAAQSLFFKIKKRHTHNKKKNKLSGSSFGGKIVLIKLE